MSDIYGILKEYFGYDSFRPAQEEIVRALVSGRDCLTVMPTGAGKSLCYQIPALAAEGITIVVSPLISLMTDQVQRLISAGVRGAYINSALTPRQVQLATENAKRGVYKIIYVSPERLLTESFLGFAAEADISLLAVDEAHCISQWGQDFRPGYLRINEFISRLPRRPTVAAFTATATNRVRGDIKDRLGLIDPLTVTTGFDRPNLYFETNTEPPKQAFLLRYLPKHRDESGIIYCSKRSETEQLASLLRHEGFSAAPYHAGLKDEQRKSTQEDFISDRIRIITATTAFGMGIDKPDVRFVVHYSIPASIEDYYQQAGRAGRDGKKSECILLFDPTDAGFQRFLLTRPTEDDPLTPSQRRECTDGALDRLDSMVNYATSKTVCLRRKLLGYFGENSPARCDNCSVCLGTIRSRAVQPHIPPDDKLLAALRKYVRREAMMRGIPPYLIAGEKELESLAAQKPMSVSELRDIAGFNADRVRLYGDGLIKVIRDNMNSQEGQR